MGGRIKRLKANQLFLIVSFGAVYLEMDRWRSLRWAANAARAEAVSWAGDETFGQRSIRATGSS
jgi:hypothetical protein